MTSNQENLSRLGFAERLRQRRIELRYSREDLIELIKNRSTNPRIGLPVSNSTLKNMENANRRYQLPKKKSSKNKPMPLDLIADALTVPLGYFLAGFSLAELEKSFYGPAVKAGHIKLISELRPQSNKDKTLAEFIGELPSTEDELFNLPLYSFRNQYALSVIFRIERVFSGYEMLYVNEPPFILWDDDDVDGWITSMDMSFYDGRIFRSEFSDYRKYFMNLVQKKQKTYKVVVNMPTLKNFVKRKNVKARLALLRATENLLKHGNFNMVIIDTTDRIETHQADGAIHECEVLCKHQIIPMSLEDTVACQILQTPPHQTPTSYFISPAPKQTVMVQRQIARIDGAWAEAISQYGKEIQLEATTSLTDPQIRAFTESLLQKICENS